MLCLNIILEQCVSRKVCLLLHHIMTQSKVRVRVRKNRAGVLDPALTPALFFGTRSRNRTGKGKIPLVFETSASTYSAIRAVWVWV